MARLLFYEKEMAMFPKQYAHELSGDDLQIIYGKLRRHFKIGGLPLRTTGRTRGGKFMGHCIIINRRSSFGILAHEVAHAIEYRKYRKTRHSGRLMRIIRRVMAYGLKKGFWAAELNRREDSRMKVRPEPSREESRALRIGKRRADLAKYHKKLSYYTKLYNGKIKRAKRSLAALERAVSKVPSPSSA